MLFEEGELFGEAGDALREAGQEYGAATGRPRRVAWIDLVATRYGAKLQAATEIVLTKLDGTAKGGIVVAIAKELDIYRDGDLAITGEDLRISRDMLLCQADVAESAGKKQMAENLRRAAEMPAVPDDKVIEMYDLLRPNRATKAQLEQMAATLENDYGAAMCARLVREALEIYEKRGILLPG